MKRIAVVGSLNMDVVIETPHMPECGETITGKRVSMIPGGKGANQAYAVGKLGGRVSMAGAVGKDSAGQALLDNLKAVGVDVSGIAIVEKGTTGQAYITVDDKGDNAIILIAGTNGTLTKEFMRDNLSMIQDSDIIIMQLEIPIDVVAYVKEQAVSLGKTVIIDPAPAVRDIPDSFWKGIDYIKPNETELSLLTGERMESKEEICKGAHIMIEKGVRNVIVTLGSDGCMLVTEKSQEFFPSHKVEAVDTTAAGDCFTAAFALALSQGKTSREAIALGQKASAIAVTRKGAQTSIPDMKEVF